MSAFIFTNDRSDGTPSVPDATNNAQFRQQLWRRVSPSGNGSSTSVYLWDDTMSTPDPTYLKWKPIGNYIAASNLTTLQSGSSKLSIDSSNNDGNVFLDVVDTNIPINNTSGTLQDSKLSSNVPLKDAAQTFAQPVTFTSGAVGALTGNADTATKWETPRTITLTGDATGSLSNVDGSADISISTSVSPAAVGNTLSQWNANLLQGNVVSDSSPANNNALVWNGTQWVPTTLALNTLDDCVIVNPAQGEVLVYDGVGWKNSDIDVGSILGAALIESSESWVSVNDKIASTQAIDSRIDTKVSDSAVTLGNTNYLSLSGQEITGGTVPTGSGGTGLTSIGTAGQVLRVKSDASGLEFGTVSGGGGGTTYTAGQGLDLSTSNQFSHSDTSTISDTSNNNGNVVQNINFDTFGHASSVQNINLDDRFSLSSHTHTLSSITDSGTAASKNVPSTGDAAGNEVVKGDDTRLTDARTPSAHTHTISNISDITASASELNLLDGVSTTLTTQEVSYLDGVTSSIQSQIDSKQAVLSEGAFADGDKTKLDGVEASADVTDATNVDNAGAVMNSDLDGKGELLVGDGSGDPTALAVGTNGFILKANSSTATGLEWSAAGSGGDVNQNAFSNIAVSGQDTVAADSTTDTLNIAAGSNVTITTNASSDTVTITSTDTDTTYSVGDGGLTQNNFTNALKTKLDGVATGAEVNVQSDWDASSGDAQILNKPNVQYTSAIPDATASQTGLATSTQITKLDGIETAADVTDATNVTAAGALMDSELTDLAGVKGLTVSTLQVKPSEGAFADGDKTKLDGIEAGATADQTGAEIKTAYEAESDTNAFTDADHTKLDGIAAGAEVNVQSDWDASSGNAQILNKPNVQYTSAIPDATASQTGLATDTQITKLDGIETAADVTDATNVAAAGALMDSELTDLAGVKGVTISTLQAKPSEGAFADGDKTKLDGIATGAEVNVQSDWDASSGDAQILNKPNVQYTSAIPDATASQTGLATSTQITKLDGIESAADVTDATNVDAAGAVMNSDSSTASMGFVVDEDDLTSNSATKVPTQQSVKAYVDTEVSGIVSSAPAALNTLNELAAALGDDAAFSTTVSTALGNRVRVDTSTQGLTSTQKSNARTNIDAASTDAATTSDNGLMSSADKSKLDGVAAGAEVNVQADWDASSGDAQILNKPTTITSSQASAITANTAKVSNVQSDWDSSSGLSEILNKPNVQYTSAIPDATASQTGLATSTQITKLDGIEASADVTDATNVAAAGALMDSELTDLAGVKAVTISTLQVKPSEGAFADGDKTKLDGIESSATADQTGAEIKSLYEAESDTNAFTDADHTKLDGIETAADVTDAANVKAALPTLSSGQFLTNDGTDLSWSDVDSLPSQSGHSGKYLTTNGSAASWATVSGGHNIIDESGSALTSRDNMTFKGELVEAADSGSTSTDITMDAKTAWLYG